MVTWAVPGLSAPGGVAAGGGDDEHAVALAAMAASTAVPSTDRVLM
jgi:hypothetical protein